MQDCVWPQQWNTHLIQHSTRVKSLSVRLVSSHLTGFCLFILILIKNPFLLPGSNTRKRNIKPQQYSYIFQASLKVKLIKTTQQTQDSQEIGTEVRIFIKICLGKIFLFMIICINDPKSIFPSCFHGFYGDFSNLHVLHSLGTSFRL